MSLPEVFARYTGPLIAVDGYLVQAREIPRPYGRYIKWEGLYPFVYFNLPDSPAKRDWFPFMEKYSNTFADFINPRTSPVSALSLAVFDLYRDKISIYPLLARSSPWLQYQEPKPERFRKRVGPIYVPRYDMPLISLFDIERITDLINAHEALMFSHARDLEKIAAASGIPNANIEMEDVKRDLGIIALNDERDGPTCLHYMDMGIVPRNSMTIARSKNPPMRDMLPLAVLCWEGELIRAKDRKKRRILLLRIFPEDIVDTILSCLMKRAKVLEDFI